MTTYLKLTEKNDHEGETWNFWLQIDGNEAQLDKLRALIDGENDEDLPYTLDDKPTPGAEVDILVKHTDCGYMDYQNKVVGVFTCPDSLGEDLDGLYKGGITDYFKTA